MKIMINESRVERLALKYMKDQLGEYRPNNNESSYWDGEFIKDGEMVGKTMNHSVHILESGYDSCLSMFNLYHTELYDIVKKAASEIADGREFNKLFILPG